MFRVNVPATSSNLSVGFDCMSIALDIYNVIDFDAMDKGLRIEYAGSQRNMPTDERNPVVRAIRRTEEIIGENIGGIYLKFGKQLPAGRGLGHDTAEIISGILIADRLLGAHMTRPQMLSIASQMTGHFDNATAALYGGWSIVALKDGQYAVRSLPVPQDLGFCIIVPRASYPVQQARGVLPRIVNRNDAVSNAAFMGQLISILYEKDYPHLRSVLNDKLAEPYREKFNPQYADISALAYAAGAYGVCPSGAGPAILAIIPKAFKDYQRLLNESLQEKGYSANWNAVRADFDRRGAVVDLL